MAAYVGASQPSDLPTPLHGGYYKSCMKGFNVEN